MRGEYTVVEGLILGPADLVEDVRLKKGDRIIGVAQDPVASSSMWLTVGLMTWSR